MTKEFLSNEDVKFEEYDVTTDSNALSEMLEVANVRTVPVTVGCGEVIIGFDKEKLNKLVNCVKG